MDLEQKFQNELQSLDKEERKELAQYVDHLLKQRFSREDLKGCLDLINSQDTKKVLKAAIITRKVLQDKDNPPIQEVIDYGLVPKFIALLKDNSVNSHTHLESLWVLTNICAGTNEQIQHCIDYDIITVVFIYLSHPSIEIQNQTLWIVGNIAADSSEYRNMILEAGILGKIVKIIQYQQYQDKEISEQITWTLRNICKVKNLPSRHEAMELISLMCSYLSVLKNQQTLIGVLYSLAELSDGNDIQKEEIMYSGILEQLVGYMGGNNNLLIAPAQRIIGNYFAGTSEQIFILLDIPNCLKNVIRQLNSEIRILRKESLWILSNIAADATFGYKIFDYESAIQKVVEMALNEGTSVAKEAYHVLLNVLDQANMAQLQKLFDFGVLKVFFKGLSGSSDIIVSVCLEGIMEIIREREEMVGIVLNQQKIKDIIEQYGYLKLLENLLKHEDNEIVDMSWQILGDFFYDDGLD